MAVSQGSGSALFAIFALAFLGALHNANAVQHVVGGSSGWSIPAIANVNYTEWAKNTSFYVGDTLLFKYIASLHNVEEVSRADYQNCNSGKPKASFDDGNTAITLGKKGNYYFICGFPGHCAAGQKLAVRALAAMVAPSPSPSLGAIPSPAAGGPVVGGEAPSSSTGSPALNSTTAGSPAGSQAGTAYSLNPTLVLSLVFAGLGSAFSFIV